MKGPVAFLFLGETLLIPHLYPIVEALSAESDIAIDLWVSTSVHETLLARWTADLDNPRLRIRRAPGFRTVADDGAGRNPPLPAKLPLLVRLAPFLMRVPVVICAEQTSLWLPSVLPMRTRFIDTFHGAGSMMARGHWRRRAGYRTLVASERDRQALLQTGDDLTRVVTTGYVKASFRQRSARQQLFGDPRPLVLYAPHWQPHRSSWWRWGRDVVRRVAADGRYNLVFAPHQRLAERVPDLRDFVASLAEVDNVHCDLDSFAMVDGSYTALADIYLGDTSSQVVEFMTRPRPCVFLNALAADWESDASYAMWRGGSVVDDLEQLLPALSRAEDRQPDFVAAQTSFVQDALGDTTEAAPVRAAREIIAALTR